MRRIVLSIWIAAFLIGTVSHARDVLAGGWLPYDFAPTALNWLWSLLLPLDLCAAILLLLKPRAGVVLGLAIIAADVAVNAWFAFRTDWLDLFKALWLQSLFCGFALGTAHILWHDTKRRLP